MPDKIWNTYYFSSSKGVQQKDKFRENRAQICSRQNPEGDRRKGDHKSSKKDKKGGEEQEEAHKRHCPGNSKESCKAPGEEWLIKDSCLSKKFRMQQQSIEDTDAAQRMREQRMAKWRHFMFVAVIGYIAASTGIYFMRAIANAVFAGVYVLVGIFVFLITLDVVLRIFECNEFKFVL